MTFNSILILGAARVVLATPALANCPTVTVSDIKTFLLSAIAVWTGRI